MSDQQSDFDGLLVQITAGGAQADAAKNRLAELVYEELKNLCHQGLWKRVHPASLTTTMMAHEAWLRVLGRSGAHFENRRHLFGAFVKAIYRIIAEHWRRKRPKGTMADPAEQPADDGGPLVSLIHAEISEEQMAALQALEAEHAWEYEVFSFSWVLGFTQEKIAAELGVPVWKVQRALQFAKAYVAKRMRPWTRD